MAGWEIVLIFSAGLAAGVINTLAGGGSLLTLPMLVFLGLPASVANGTNRVAIWVQCVVSSWRFRREGFRHMGYSLKLAAPAVVGAIAGAQLSIEISDVMFERIFAVIMVMMVGFILWNPRVPESTQSHIETMKRPWLSALVFFLIGIYGGMIQAGVGYFLTAALVLIAGLDLVATASVKVLVIAVYTTFALAVFIWNGEVDWLVAVVLSLGNGLGGWLGAKIALQKGEKWIRIALAVTVIVMALKMFDLLPVLPFE